MVELLHLFAENGLIEDATAAVKDGCDMRVAQEPSGHKNVRTNGAHDIGNN
jgi:hypothetical protein